MAEPPVSGLTVVKASYGVSPNFIDVTDNVILMIQDGDLTFTVSPQSLGILDPAPGVQKEFQAQVVINGGIPSNLSKVDGEVFAISAPPLKGKKKDVNHAFNIFTALWYCFVFGLAGYLGYSGYRLGAESVGSPMLGYFFLFVVGGGFFALGTAEAGTGILGLIAASPGLLAIIPIVIFWGTLWTPDFIDYEQLKKPLGP